MEDSGRPEGVLHVRFSSNIIYMHNKGNRKQYVITVVAGRTDGHTRIELVNGVIGANPSIFQTGLLEAIDASK